MTNNHIKNKESNLQIQIVINIIAITLILFTDFAGWYHYNYYAKFSQEGYIYLGSGIVSTLILTAMIILLASNTKAAYANLKNTTHKQKHLITYTKIALTTTIIAGLTFAIDCMSTETQEWWFGPAFYGLIIAYTITLTLNKK